MSKIILFVGLPGSGKTFLANKMCDIVVDDITGRSELPTNENLGNHDLGITDVNFCDENILNKATEFLKTKYQNHTIGIVYFENDPVKCRKNVEFRDDGRNVEGTIRRFEKIYNPPPNGARKIWTKHG